MRILVTKGGYFRTVAVRNLLALNEVFFKIFLDLDGNSCHI